eukprot:TRINITY_DN3347_c0_g2_i1.p3 TRINITY_DN3347_c0_g2~~TRINITY_DN3347_c0_g2_i1.p3  ORF type:complete len:105 (-),score=0.35 TRINITY_DN3347_c0_g2_i1:17-331(-)
MATRIAPVRRSIAKCLPSFAHTFISQLRVWFTNRARVHGADIRIGGTEVDVVAVGTVVLLTRMASESVLHDGFAYAVTADIVDLKDILIASKNTETLCMSGVRL